MKLKLSFVFIFVVFTFGVSLSAGQSTCPVQTFNVRKIVGRLVSQGRDEVAIPRSKLELFALKDERQIKDVFTDDQGRFDFGSVKDAKYRLRSWFTVERQTFMKFDIIVSVNRRLKANSNKRLVIRLSTDCFTSDAKLLTLN